MKNHLAAPPPISRLRVVCIFCTDKRKGVSQDSGLEAAWNEFWMALHPKDYSQIVGAASKESSAAVQARVKLFIWLGKCPNKSRSRIEWQLGWEMIYNHSARRPLGASSLPVQKENNQKISIKLGQTSSEHLYQIIRMILMAPPYSPSSPEIRRELTIHHHIKIDSPNSAVEVFYKISQVWCKVDIRCQDERDACSLLRKMMAVTSDSCRSFPDGDGSQETSENVKREIVALLEVPNLFKIMRFMPLTFVLGCMRKELPMMCAMSIN
ncbi:hypothetical protein ACJMK2_039642 [Sinanodonta woodiana]|uniref:Uncharacterized protein n=1 Tax=Sinanodonta woodiana TaxID=1069815 RepID=A0ABD3WFY2_SINWO